MDIDSIGKWISMLYRCSQTNLLMRLEPYGISRGQHRFLIQLFYRDGLTQGELAHALSMDKSSVARALAKLEKAGFVSRVRENNNDKRLAYVHLTDKAREMEETVASILSNWTQSLSDGLNEEEKKQALLLLKHMASNANRSLVALKETPISF